MTNKKLQLCYLHGIHLTTVTMDFKWVYSRIDIEINDEFVNKIEINQSNLESDSPELNDDKVGFPIEADQTYLDFTSISDKNLIIKTHKAIAQINESSFNKEIFSNMTEDSSEFEFKRLNSI
ncbi:hypothetical protein BLOT_016644 [Blomia tropicalis]|nr:hypothetical protein BLOT_016644 [Blomia tropicalis]